MSKKETVTFEGVTLASAGDLLETAQIQCVRLESQCGKPDIKEVLVESITITYQTVTSSDKYHGLIAASIVRDEEQEPESDPHKEKLPEPKLLDRKGATRDFANEPPDVFGEIDNDDDANYGPDSKTDALDFHQADATGVPDDKEMLPKVGPHGETLEEELDFNEKDILADNEEPPGWDTQS